MTINELLARTPEETTKDYSDLAGFVYSHFPEIADHDWFKIDWNKNLLLTQSIYKHFDYDGRRFWKLASVSFDGVPFMIVQNAGREGDDHVHRFIIDSEGYLKTLNYLKDLYPISTATESKNTTSIAPHERVYDLPKLDKFYDGELDGYFERYRY
jgi:hypothetical protein